MADFYVFGSKPRIMTHKTVVFELSENNGMRDDFNKKGASWICFNFICLNLTRCHVYEVKQCNGRGEMFIYFILYPI